MRVRKTSTEATCTPCEDGGSEPCPRCPDAELLTAEAEITDENEGPVAHRTFKHPAHECAPLARAVGVWASLVLDAELDRAAEREREKKRAKLQQAKNVADPDTTPDVSLWPPPIDNESPPPEHYPFLKHSAKERTIELGASAFLMDGVGSGAIAGPQAYTVLEATPGLFLRFSLSLGRTVEPLRPSHTVYGTWGATRADACARMPGLYRDRGGLQLDLCGGMDLGFLYFDGEAPSKETLARHAGEKIYDTRNPRTIPYLGVGPSLGLRGELGNDLAVLIRGVLDLNVIRQDYVDTAGMRVELPLFTMRGEVGVSWRVR
jgi:hypothetical protein